MRRCRNSLIGTAEQGTAKNTDDTRLVNPSEFCNTIRLDLPVTLERVWLSDTTIVPGAGRSSFDIPARDIGNESTRISEIRLFASYVHCRPQGIRCRESEVRHCVPIAMSLIGALTDISVVLRDVRFQSLGILCHAGPGTPGGRYFAWPKFKEVSHKTNSGRNATLALTALARLLGRVAARQALSTTHNELQCRKPAEAVTSDDDPKDA